MIGARGFDVMDSSYGVNFCTLLDRAKPHCENPGVRAVSHNHAARFELVKSLQELLHMSGGSPKHFGRHRKVQVVQPNRAGRSREDSKALRARLVRPEYVSNFRDTTVEIAPFLLLERLSNFFN